MFINNKNKQFSEMDNNDIMELHRVCNQGGIRKSNRTQSFVLIMNHRIAKYEDKTDNSRFEIKYDGAFTTGKTNQLMTNMNMALANTKWPLHVYERKRESHRILYDYVGVYENQGIPAKTIRDGRIVYVYTLRRITPTVTYDFDTFEF